MDPHSQPSVSNSCDAGRIVPKSRLLNSVIRSRDSDEERSRGDQIVRFSDRAINSPFVGTVLPAHFQLTRVSSSLERPHPACWRASVTSTDASKQHGGARKPFLSPPTGPAGFPPRRRADECQFAVGFSATATCTKNPIRFLGRAAVSAVSVVFRRFRVASARPSL